jgi:hypothetical protein
MSMQEYYYGERGFQIGVLYSGVSSRDRTEKARVTMSM